MWKNWMGVPCTEGVCDGRFFKKTLWCHCHTLDSEVWVPPEEVASTMGTCHLQNVTCPQILSGKEGP